MRSPCNNLQKADFYEARSGSCLPFLKLSQGFHANLHITKNWGIFSGQAGPVVSPGPTHGHSLPSSVHLSLGGQGQPPPLLCCSGQWAKQTKTLPHSPRTAENWNLDLSSSQRHNMKRLFLSENIKELGLLCQDFYFKTARLILYTCLHLGISFSNLIWKEMIFREEKKSPCLSNWLQDEAVLHFNPRYSCNSVISSSKFLCIFG